MAQGGHMPGSFSCSPSGPILVFSLPHSVHTQVCVVSSGGAVIGVMVRAGAFCACGALGCLCRCFLEFRGLAQYLRRCYEFTDAPGPGVQEHERGF